MKDQRNQKRPDDVKAWVTIALIDAVATAAVCGLFLWLSGVAS